MLKTSILFPRYDIDNDGAKIVRVPMTDTHDEAKIFTTDFEMLRDLQYFDTWVNGAKPSFGEVQLRFKPDDTQVIAARVISRAESGTKVRYVDGDKLNLRKDNLQLVRGKGKQTDLDALYYAAGRSLIHRYSFGLSPHDLDESIIQVCKFYTKAAADNDLKNAMMSEPSH